MGEEGEEISENMRLGVSVGDEVVWLKYVDASSPACMCRLAAPLIGIQPWLLLADSQK